VLLTDWFWHFAVYSFLGWLLESIFISFKQHRLVNRGFLNGPFCPVYGFGALLVLLVLSPLHNYWPLLLLAGIFLTTGLEYLTSWLLETLFHARWWDYSKLRFNLHGRITLFHSLGWGALSLVLAYLLDPLLSQLLARTDPKIRLVLALLLLALMLLDLAVTIAGAVGLNRQLARLHEMTQLVRQKNSEFGQNLQARMLFIVRSFRDWRNQAEKLSSIQRRILLAFPNFQSHHYSDALHKLRRLVKKQRPQLIWPDADIMLLRSQLLNQRRNRGRKHQ
jgi:uncharacterized membrane protein